MNSAHSPRVTTLYDIRQRNILDGNHSPYGHVNLLFLPPRGEARRMNDPCPSISSQSRAQRASRMLFFGNKRCCVDASPVMVGRSIGETSTDRSGRGDALSGCQGNETSGNEEEFRGCFRNERRRGFLLLRSRRSAPHRAGPISVKIRWRVLGAR